MKTVDEFKAGLLEAMGREKAAAERVACALDGVRLATERIDPSSQRKNLTEAREAFEELTRQASYRNYVAARFAEAVGLKREMTVAALILALGQAGKGLRAMFVELGETLDRVKAGFTVLALVSKYGNAMTASLMEIRGEGRCAVPYGRNGQRTASYARAGRLA